MSTGSNWLRKGMHLGVASSFALSQPLLDVLGRNPAFFAIRGSSGAQIVLFAVALTAVPPLVLLAVEAAAAKASLRLARAVHVAFVGSLIAVFALHAVTKSALLPGESSLLAAALAGSLAALAYARVRLVGSFLTLLAPAPLVFLAAFLFASPVSRLVLPEAPVAHAAATVNARTPVVLIVLDELSTVSLMNRQEHVDRRRFPNFASLARGSTWYRSATTTYWLTEVAVPSLLTGRVPAPKRLPILADHPGNLYTLLHPRYRVEAVEPLTRLCPPAVCRRTRRTQLVDGSFNSLLADAGVVYLNTVVPKPYASRIPSIGEAWGNFGGHRDPEARSAGYSHELPACARNVCEFLDLLEPHRRPTLYVLHTVLPHVPYVYLPSGRRYAVDTPLLRGLENGRWANREGARQSYIRYLLQLGYADRALGLILRKLRSNGLYDRALVVVTADHGVTFKVPQPRRLPTRANLDDIAFVPLFVKLPGQRRGRVVDSFAQTIDVVPTIARALGVSIPWRVDGRPLVGRRLSSDGTVWVMKPDGSRVSAPLSSLRARRARSFRTQVAMFGTGSFGALYRRGPNAELIGRRVDDFSVRGGAGRVVLDRGPLLDAVDPSSGLLPTYIEGEVHGAIGSGRAVAIAVDGTIRAVARSYRQHGKARFAAFVPETALRRGPNAVAVYAVTRASAGVVLSELANGESGRSLVVRGGRETIESPRGAAVQVEPGAISGIVRVGQRGSAFLFTGWARIAKATRPPKSLVVLVDGQEIFGSPTTVVRPLRVLGDFAPKRTLGFSFELPSAALPAPGRGASVRVFALHGRLASELRYAGPYPWPSG